MPDNSSELARCDREVQLALEAVLAEGDHPGLYSYLFDWQAERRIIEEQEG